MKPSRQFRPSLQGHDQLEDRKVLSSMHPYYHQRIPVYQPAQTQVLPTPTIPRITPSAIRTYDLVPPPGQVNPTGAISMSYQVTGATIVPFGYTYSNAQPGTAMVSVAGVPSGGTGPKSQVIAVGTLGQRQSFYQTAATEMITTNPALFRAGFVSVGVTPTTYDATTKVTSSSAGELRILNVVGSPVMILRDPTLVSGPTALAWVDKGNAASLFVSNGINGVVSRFDFKIYQRGTPAIKLVRATQIAGGYTTAGAATTSLQGPAGMSYDQASDTLYVASTLDNKVYAINRASRVANSAVPGRVAVNSAQVTAPTGVTLSPSRTLLVAGDLANGMTGLAEFGINGGYLTSLSTGTLPAGSGSVTWQPSLYGFGPEVVQVNANDNTIQFLPIIQN
jgi:hypothetical protein